MVGFEQMLRRRQINGNPGGRGARAFAALADVVRWPFERVAWGFERLVLWPLGERFAGFSPPARGAGAAALGAIAVGAVLAGVLLHDGGSSPRDRVAESTQVAVATPRPAAEEPSGPVLHGVTPDFSGGVSAPADSPAAAELNAGGDGEAASTEATAGDEVANSDEAAAATS